MMRALMALAFLTAFAGCSSPPGAEAGLPEEPPTGATAAAGATTVREVAYTFAGLVTGAAPPDPNAEGPLVAAVPPAQEGTFEVRPGAIALDVTATHTGGTGSARVEVLGPDGATAYVSDRWDSVGAPGVASVGVEWQSERQAEGALPGTYTVRYLVAGLREIAVEAAVTYPVAGPVSGAA